MSHESTSMRFRLRADAYFVKSLDGVWLRNNHGSFSIHGGAAYQLVRFLFRKLQGGATLAELCLGGGEQQREIILGVVRRLQEHSFIQPVVDDEAIPAWANGRYGDQLRFIGHYREAPFARFLAFRRCAVLCRGEGPVLQAVMAALIEYGASDVRLEQVQPDSVEREKLTTLAAAAAERDPDAAFTLHTEASIPEEAGRKQSACTLLALSCADLPGGFDLPAEPGGAVAAVYLAGDVLVVSPVLTPDAPVCLECVRRVLVPRPMPRGATGVGPAAASLAANQLVYGLFCHHTGIPSDEDLLVRTVDLRTLTVGAHRLLPHSLCRRHGASVAPVFPTAWTGQKTRPDVQSALDNPDVVRAQDKIAIITARWCDSRTGPLLYVGERDHPQIPLALSECVVRRLAEGSAPEEYTVLCAGLSAREARNQVVLLALERLGADLLAPADRGRKHPARLTVLGAGWSLDEAAYRALHHAALAWPAPRLDPVAADEQDLLVDLTARYLAGVVQDRAPHAPRLTAAQSPTGLFTATARAGTGIGGQGAGTTSAHAMLNALFHLAAQLAAADAERPDVQQALLSPPTGSWAEALELAAARRGLGALPLVFRDLSGGLPFARNHAYLVSVECIDEQDVSHLDRG